MDHDSYISILVRKEQALHNVPLKVLVGFILLVEAISFSNILKRED